MATRGIHHERERLATLAVVPLIPCSARFPIYVLLVGTFIPAASKWGGLVSLQGLVLFGIYISGFLAAIFTSKALQWLGFFAHSAGQRDSLYHLELPELKAPRWSRLTPFLWERLKGFIFRLSGVLILGGMILWYLSHFPKEWQDDPLASSYAGLLGHWLEPFFRVCGFDWKIIVSLIPSFAARELVIGALATLYSSEPGQLSAVLSAAWSLPTGLALLTWFIFAAQCFSTLAVLGSEAKSWWFPLGVFVYLNTLAYVGAICVYQLSVRFL
jgi:ferrous iron transport protein B